MELLEFVFRLLAAIGLGAVIGVERQLSGRAGIRTCVLVCMGSALFTIFPLCIVGGDVTRAAMQIISGVGFLGSGIIFKDGSNIRGINTAATVWCTAGVGVFAGAGLYLLAAIAAGSLLAVNVILRLLTNSGKLWGRFDGGGHVTDLTLTCEAEQARAVRERLTALLSEDRFYLIHLRSRRAGELTRLEARFAFDGRNYVAVNEALAWELSHSPAVRETNWEAVE